MTYGTLVTKELCECLKSLNESDYELYRDKRFRKRHVGTCSWIFSNTNYRYWLENDDSSIVWIHGAPGFGKSVLSAVLSKELIRDQHICFDQECSVAYFFCGDKDIHLKTSTALLTNVLAQLLRQNPRAMIHFSKEPIYNIDKEKTSWTFGMLWRVFSRIVNDAKLKPMFVIIDAIGMLSSHLAGFYEFPKEHPANSI
jgi:Cdc6-like AAA superfamily ATPase